MARIVNKGGRSVHQTPLEQFVIGYLKRITSTSNFSGEFKYLEKSVALINKFLGFPCCLEDAATYTLITPNDNQLTNMIRTTLLNNKVIRRGFLLSLHRILDRLNFALYSCCTLESEIIFSSANPANVRITLTDAITGDLLAETNLVDSNQVFLLPAKYFYPNGIVKACLNIVNDPSPNSYALLDGDFNPIVTASSVGTHCGVIKPTLAIYFVQTI